MYFNAFMHSYNSDDDNNNVNKKPWDDHNYNDKNNHNSKQRC